MNYPNREFVSDYLHSLRADIGNERQSINVSGYTEAWTKLLKKKPGEIVLNLDVMHRYHASPHDWDGVFVGSYLSRQFYDVNSSGFDRDLNEFLSIETSCVLFNDSLAGALNLPYLTSSFRSCVYSEILGRKIRGPLSDASDDEFKRPHVFDVVVSENAPRIYSSSSKRKSLYTDYFSAPFLLGIILEKMKKPEDYWPILLEYRNKLVPLRRKILEDRDKWQGRETGYANELLKPLIDLRKDRRINLDDAKDIVESSLEFACALPTAKGIDINLVSLGLKLIKLLKPYALKYFKPELYALHNLSDEAQRLREVESTIKRIWGTLWEPGSIAVLKHLASLDSRMFIQLADLGQ